MYREQKRADREKLYQEVWSTPMLQLAKQYGCSDRGLAKLCERMNIPVPPRGYWARKEAGQKVAQPPLPPLSEGQDNFAVYHAITLEPSSPKDQSLEEFEHRLENRIAVATEGAQLHPLAAGINQALEKAKEDPSGILTSEAEWCYVIRVSKGTRERAIRILDALFRAFEARGHTMAYDKEKKYAFVQIGAVRETFTLEELLDRKERALTKAQEKDKIKNPWMYSYPEYDKVPSGRLRLKASGGWGIDRTSWTDGTRQRVEECLNRFMAVMAKAAVRDLERQIEWEREELEREERERLAEERRKRKLAEQRRLWALLTESTSWHESQRIREYVEAVKERAAHLGSSAQEDQALGEWIAWALRQAESLDPLAEGAYCVKEERRSSPTKYGEAETKPEPMELVWSRMLRRSHY
jgi:hypothetical protein